MTKPIRATLDNGKGDVLAEGEGLTLDAIQAALVERFPAPEARREQVPRVVVEFDDGAVVRPWRFAGDAPRIVDRTVYL